MPDWIKHWALGMTKKGGVKMTWRGTHHHSMIVGFGVMVLYLLCFAPIIFGNTGYVIGSQELVLVKSGSFQMGDEIGDLWDECRPVHTVTLTYDFWISKYEVTFDEYDAYFDAIGELWSKPYDQWWGRETRPAIGVSWNSAVAYCNWLSQREGLNPAYDRDGTLLDSNGQITTDITKVEGYRLPTEAEWEYAARGGHKSEADYKYAGSDTVEEVSWFWDNVNQKTEPVGLKKPNELGLHDMSGNVSEWCYDRFDWDYYKQGDKANPIGPSEGTNRVLRGGSWADRPRESRVAYRGYNSQDFSFNALGFRIARTAF